RGISENDQRERLLVTVMQADLDNRTFQYLLPFANYIAFTTPPGTKPASTDPRSPEYYKADRKGYFYISENDPNDDTDDILQFTVSTFSDPSQDDDTEGFYYGRANMNHSFIPTAYKNLTNHPNQPDADDGRIVADGTSQSSAVEVSYFLRGSNLYRRELLIREPLTVTGVTDSQPQTSNGIPYFLRPGGSIPDPLYSDDEHADCNFWRDFDFSAFRYETPPSGSGIFSARLHDLTDLDNSSPSTDYFPLGRPHYRFGFNHATGLSREYMTSSSASNPQLFIGRFTHEETSHVNFNYPQDLMPVSLGGGGNPMDPTGPNLVVNSETRVVEMLKNGPRRSEDLVLANVRSFDIKVFDDRYQDFVDIGDPALPVTARFAAGAKQNAEAGNTEWKNVFDTWHPATSVASDFDPPYPMLSDSAGLPVYDLTDQGTEHYPSPLTAIRILVRYEDPTSGQVRQMTLIHPLRSRSEE
ncbi:MAG TPA: hypothetical protein DDZ90_06375, partial [Planctomycetaceae bacterium]|nr:hypothetical protein [Planctomycetaceae bacterium]